MKEERPATLPPPSRRAKQPQESISIGPLPLALFLKVANFALPTRAANYCNAANIVYVGDLVRRSKKDLLAQKNLGRKSVDVLDTLVRRMGLELGRELPNWDLLDHEKVVQRYKGALKHALRGTVDTSKPVAKPTNVEDEVAQRISALTPREQSMFLARIGWASETDPTLAEIGATFEVTRERVRQVLKRARERLMETDQECPLLDRSLEYVRGMQFATTSAVEQTLAQTGIVREDTRVRSLLQAAQLLGIDTGVVVQRAPHVQYVLTEGMEDVPQLIAKLARRAVGSHGCTTVADVASALAEQGGVTASQQSVSSLLVHVPGFAWLDEQTGWFWITTVQRNRLLNQLDKALSVAKTLDLTTLKSALRRHHRMGEFSPPRRVLSELCVQLDDCIVTDGGVVDVADREPGDLLSDAEQTLFLLMKDHGPVLGLAELERLALHAGMNKATFQMTLFNSPIIRRYDKAVYGLIGEPVTPGAVRDAQAPRVRKGSVLRDGGYTEDGKIWVVYQLSNGAIRGGVLSVPSGLAPYLHGEFMVKGPEGATMTTLRVKGSQAWGFLPYFSRSEPEEGDFLRVLFDSSNLTARVELFDEPPDEIATELPQAAAV